MAQIHSALRAKALGASLASANGFAVIVVKAAHEKGSVASNGEAERPPAASERALCAQNGPSAHSAPT